MKNWGKIGEGDIGFRPPNFFLSGPPTFVENFIKIEKNIATVGARTDIPTYRQKDTSDFIICPMLCYSNLTYNNYFMMCMNFYLRQVNEVNGGDNAFVRCVCVCLCVCLCVRSCRSWELNANSSKTVKATDFTFDTHVPSDSPNMTSKNFPKRGRGHGHVTP